jgi:hypothetical protein
METHNSPIHLQQVNYIQWQTRRWSNSLGGWGMTLVIRNRRNLQSDCYSLNINILVKTTVLHFALTSFCSWGCANSDCRLFDIAVPLCHVLIGFSYSALHNFCLWLLLTNPKSFIGKCS